MRAWINRNLLFRCDDERAIDPAYRLPELPYTEITDKEHRLYLLVENSSAEDVKEFLRRNPELNVDSYVAYSYVDYEGYASTALSVAVANNDDDKVRALLDHGADRHLTINWNARFSARDRIKLMLYTEEILDERNIKRSIVIDHQPLEAYVLYVLSFGYCVAPYFKRLEVLPAFQALKDNGCDLSALSREHLKMMSDFLSDDNNSDLKFFSYYKELFGDQVDTELRRKDNLYTSATAADAASVSRGR